MSCAPSHDGAARAGSAVWRGVLVLTRQRRIRGVMRTCSIVKRHAQLATGTSVWERAVRACCVAVAPVVCRERGVAGGVIFLCGSQTLGVIEHGRA